MSSRPVLKCLPAIAAVAALSVSTAPAAAEWVDWDAVSRIREEGFQRSEVMDVLEHLADEIGPRLTGSPAMTEANEWTRDKLAEWGLADSHLEAWGPFGRGWSFTRASVHMLAPRKMPLLALPKAWTPGTDGPLTGPAMAAEVTEEEDFEEYKGKLAGKIVFISEAREIKPEEKPSFRRHSEESLDELIEFPIPKGDLDARRKRYAKRLEFRKKLTQFLSEEGVLAVVDISSRDGGTIRLGGAGSREPEGNVGPPTIAMMTEHYNWILRLLDKDKEVELEIDVDAGFHGEDTMAYNTIAEIPGRGSEIVMVGAHLDSWHAGTGSNDNGAGSAIAMEAVRILQAIGVEPKRTIRVALWSGEEQGILGSQGYVSEHFAARPEPEEEEEKKLPSALWKKQFPLDIKPDHKKLSAYFNLDNGSGKIRGVYTQQNAAVVPIFRAWLEPLHDIGADTVTNRNTGATDHIAFDRMGLPGFQFIQDGLDYFTRTHHSNLDVFDHAQEDDLKQASVVMASFLYHAAMRDELLPRKPMPRERPKKKEDEEKEGEPAD